MMFATAALPLSVAPNIGEAPPLLPRALHGATVRPGSSPFAQTSGSIIAI